MEVRAMAKRKGLSKKTRFEVFKRDHFTCQYCGRTPPAVVLEADHIVPVASGGQNDQINLLTSCFECNRGKSDGDLGVVIQPLADQMKVERERLEQVKEFNKLLMELRQDQDGAIERLGIHWNDKLARGERWIFGSKRRDSVRLFLKSLAEGELLDLIDLTFSRIPASIEDDEQAFKYFCGCCWKRIKGVNGGPK